MRPHGPTKLLRNLAIRKKMLAMSLLICGAVLCLAILVLFTFQVLNSRSSFQRDTSTLAVIIANNSTAAVAFRDEEAAKEVVAALAAKPTILGATLALPPDHTVFARYGRIEDARTWSQFPPAAGYRFIGGQLLVTQPVLLKGEQVGTLYLRSDYRNTFLRLFALYGEIVLIIVLVSVILAAFLSRQLGRTITDPVLQLAQIAQVVGEKKDYSVRVTVDGRNDELGALAESFNEMLGRIQSQDAALSLSQQKMEALINSIDGIVWERFADGHRFTFVSRQSEHILGYSPEAWLERPNFWEEKLHPQDAAKAARTSHEMAGRGQSYTQEYRMMAADGRTVWIRESGTVLVERGKASAVRGIFQDITRQKSDAEQLDKLNRKLMETSRQAGMAEVATGVLHNVGNVLNSVSVSATDVSRRLRESRIPKLCRAAAMLREQNGRLAEYLTVDSKGKLLPDYLATVADQLVGEQSKLIEKMDLLGEHIGHIKEVVALQQGYAKVSGVFEDLPVAGLVEDALRMNEAAFDRHGIELVREFAGDLPLARVDRHKVLQILINLLRNAKYAMEQKGGPAKRLVVRVGAGEEGRLKVTVVDNGVGIAPENLTRIFNHGFTTKKDGHGFGLHSGANAAREMGGRLTAHSDGPGRGAEFALELPASSAVRQQEPAAASANA